MNVVELTKQLVRLQSFDDGALYEKPMSDFLIAYATETFPWMTLTVQKVAPNRFNVLMRDAAPTRLLVIDQMDTVVPDIGWRTDPLQAVEESGKLYGLGASDSKGNVAAFLTALEMFGETRGLAMLFYVDEEYFFKGMETFIMSDLSKSMSPSFVLSIDGNGSALGVGCRGLVEFDVCTRSASGHSANPKIFGALKPLLETFAAFSSWLNERSLVDAPKSNAQISFVRGGTIVSETEQGAVFAKEGNRIPNFAEAKIEVRTAPNMGWAEIGTFWCERLGSWPDLRNVLSPVSDYAGFSTCLEDLDPVVRAVDSVLGSVPLVDASAFGYLDIAMMRRAYPGAALCSFGVGESGVTHQANEYVRMAALETGVSVYTQVLNNLGLRG